MLQVERKVTMGSKKGLHLKDLTTLVAFLLVTKKVLHLKDLTTLVAFLLVTKKLQDLIVHY